VSDLRTQLQATLGDSYTLERELGGGGLAPNLFQCAPSAMKRAIDGP